MKVGHMSVIPYLRPGAPATADAVERAIVRHGALGAPLRAVVLSATHPSGSERVRKGGRHLAAPVQRMDTLADPPSIRCSS